MIMDYSGKNTISAIGDFVKGEIPTSLPANGGNADTVNNHTVNTDVPSSAKFTDTTYSAATQSTNGLMSAADKEKLDGIATGANNYSLPTATSSVLGGVKIGSNISISSGTISISKTNVTTALGYTPISSISGVCAQGTTTKVDITLGWKPSSVIIVDSNAPSSVYVPNAISSTGFSCGYLPEGTMRTYWAFK